MEALYIVFTKLKLSCKLLDFSFYKFLSIWNLKLSVRRLVKTSPNFLRLKIKILYIEYIVHQFYWGHTFSIHLVCMQTCYQAPPNHLMVYKQNSKARRVSTYFVSIHTRIAFRSVFKSSIEWSDEHISIFLLEFLYLQF